MSCDKNVKPSDKKWGTLTADLFGRGTATTPPVPDSYKDTDLKLRSTGYIWHLRLQSKRETTMFTANKLASSIQKRQQDACMEMEMFFPKMPNNLTCI